MAEGGQSYKSRLITQFKQMVPRDISNIKKEEELLLKLQKSDVGEHDDQVSIEPWDVPMCEKYRDKESMTRHLVSKQMLNAMVDTSQKTILVIGETGSGKTKFIDSLFNFIVDVNWEDDFRWQLTKLTDKEKEKRSNESITQTEWITVYTTPRFIGDVPFSFNIIDTPGFGESVEKDTELRKHLKSFFCDEKAKHGIRSLDAVCIVVTASNPRCTPAQQYLFESILAIFGKDVKDNIFGIATNADNTVPKVFKAMSEKVPTKAKFKVNNAALYAANQGPNVVIDEHNWKMNHESYKELLREILHSKSISTNLTKEVLEKREQLLILLEAVSKKVESNCKEMETLKGLNEKLVEHIDEMKENQDFKILVVEIQKKENTNGFLTKTLFCGKCKIECHHPCVPLKVLMWACNIFTKGICQHCKCKREDHEMKSTHTESVRVETRQTKADVERRFLRAKEQKDKQSSLMDVVAERYNGLKQKVLHDIDNAHNFQLELNRIALVEDPLTKVDIINHIIAMGVGDDQSRQLTQKYKVLADLHNAIITNAMEVESIRKVEVMKRYVAQAQLYQKNQMTQ